MIFVENCKISFEEELIFVASGLTYAKSINPIKLEKFKIFNRIHFTQTLNCVQSFTLWIKIWTLVESL